jgi:predicted nucleotidyltransferase
VAKRPRIDFLEILRILRRHEVDCIVVGGVSGVLHGAPIGSLAVRVIDLDTLIELKEQAGRDKDTAVLAILKRTREEGRKSGDR